MQGSACGRDLDEARHGRPRAIEEASFSPWAAVLLESLREALRPLVEARSARRRKVEQKRSSVGDLGLPGEPARGTSPRRSPEELGSIHRAARTDVEVLLESPVENLQTIRGYRVRAQVSADVVDGARPDPLAPVSRSPRSIRTSHPISSTANPAIAAPSKGAGESESRTRSRPRGSPAGDGERKHGHEVMRRDPEARRRHDRPSKELRRGRRRVAYARSPGSCDRIGRNTQRRTQTRSAAPSPTCHGGVGGPAQMTRCSPSEIMTSASSRNRSATRLADSGRRASAMYWRVAIREPSHTG